MQFFRGGGGGGGLFGGTAWEAFRRHLSRKRAVDVRRVKPKVPKEEAVAISGRLLQILADHGPLTVGNTWNHAKVILYCTTLLFVCIVTSTLRNRLRIWVGPLPFLPCCIAFVW
jgi:hypothetical protein